MRRVGILGGMGPEATVALMARVIALVDARDDADHVPLIVDQNTQVPSRIARIIEGQGADPGPELVAMAQRLQGAGAQALALACNTAQLWADDIRGAVTVPFLDMVGASVAQAGGAAGAAEVGILASPAVRMAGVYDRACAAAGVVPVYGVDEAALLALIRRIKAEGAHDGTRADLRALSEALPPRVQIIACTEFSLVADAAAPGVRAIDAMDVLARAIVDFAKGGV